MTEEQSINNSKRPESSPEQMQAFGAAYTMLAKLATQEDQSEQIVLAWSSEKTQESGRYYGQPGDEKFAVDANASQVFVTLGDGTEGWMNLYGEKLSHEAGVLATLTAVKSREKGNNVRDRYYFYPDGNIELRHWEDHDPSHQVMKYLRDQIGEGNPEYLHSRWLSVQETEYLTSLIEDSVHSPHVEPPLGTI